MAEEGIIKIVESRVMALHDKDVEATVAHYAPNILIYDLAPPLSHSGIDREGLAEWFKTWDGPIELKIRDLDVTASEDVAFATSLQRMNGNKIGAPPPDELQSTSEDDKPGLWFGVTTCLERIDGEWGIVHEHESTPFYMDGSFKAAIDLKP